MIIDGHQHVITDINSQLKQNISAGIDRVVLFSTLVHPESARNKNEFVAEMNKLNSILTGQLNATDARMKAFDELIAAIKSAPNYFCGFGNCPFGLGYDETSDWIEKKIVANGFLGIGEVTLGSGMISKLENIFRYVHESGKNLPIWIHTFNPIVFGDIKEILKLAKTYPKAKVVMGHGGGSNWLELIEVVGDLENVYVDVSASFTGFSIKYLAECLPERVVFSSDIPYGDPDFLISQIKTIVPDKNIQKNILGENTLRLLED